MSVDVVTMDQLEQTGVPETAWEIYANLTEDATVEGCREALWGEADSGRDFARQFAGETGEVPESGDVDWPLYCIDWDHAWRELEYDCFYFEDGYIFKLQ
jgi:antirestriction protein